MSKEKESIAVNSKKKKKSKKSNSANTSKKPKIADNSQENSSSYFYSLGRGKSTKQSNEKSFEETRHNFASNVWQHQYHPYQRHYSNNWCESRPYNRFPQTYEQSHFSNRGRRGGHVEGVSRGGYAKKELTEEEQRFAKATKNLKESRVENAVKVSSKQTYTGNKYQVKMF